MNKLTILIFFFALNGFSQERYKADIFSDYEVAYDVQFGTATTQGNQKMKLTMDVYSPKGDTIQNRPLVILAHGGYFTMGDKASFQDECRQLARKGYVAVTMNYRLIDVVGDSLMTSKIAAIDAIHDMKACVRYFYKDAETDNQYKIDLNNIIVGGYSAGAITALHYAYASTKEDILTMGGKELLMYVAANGGTEGESGNPGYPSKIKGVINIAGSLQNAALVDANEPPLISVHGNEDLTVPFETGLTGETLVQTEGSGLIHKQADAVGLKNKLIELDGEDHIGYYYCSDCFDQIVAFMAELIAE